MQFVANCGIIKLLKEKTVIILTTEMMIAAGTENDLEILTTDVIRQLGIPAHLKGYRYLRYALILCVENSEMISSVTKLLYPAVAAKFETTSCCVNSSIRQAVAIAWNKGNREILSRYLGGNVFTRETKPTNAEFIASVSETLRLGIKRQNSRR